MEPGTPAFFPDLLAYIRELAPPSLPVDPVVFQSILLCLVAASEKQKHLLLRAPAKDVRLVVKLAFLTLSSVFGLPAHKLKVRPPSVAPTHGAPFLRSLFLPWSTSMDSQDETLSSKPTVGSRNRTRNNATWARSLSKKPRHSISELGTVSSNPFSGDDGLSSASSSMINPFSTAPRSVKGRAPLPHAFSDPTPLRPKPDRATTLQPRALVISGLENATISSQRALSKALAEKRVVLEDEDGDEAYDEVWNLPDGFIMVYVCPIDVCERPAIHKTLLDKFAMSATVVPHHSIRSLLASPSRNSGSHRNSPALHSTPLPSSPPTSTSAPSLHHSHSLPPFHHHVHHSLLQQPLFPSSLMHELRALYSRTHLSPLLSLYASDLLTAARHHPQLDGMLLTAKSNNDVLDLARAGRVIGGDLTGMELLREDAAFAAAKAHENGQANNKHEAAQYDEPGTPASPAVTTPTPGLAAHQQQGPHHYQPIEVVVEEADGESVMRSLGGSRTQVHESEEVVLEVSEADVARIAPRVMTHRLRVRNGPEDEVLASARYAAVGEDSSRPNQSKDPGRITIKEILVRILAEV
ncbi:hypothetical protein R3P38DRAFT_3039713 [Favolaschia claudopus]|uniref:Uncharacterized protein n=1 Tax=Favolaschia claudopus TaxID=2862362 RepID=A0AAW0A9H7_9AGAR